MKEKKKKWLRVSTIVTIVILCQMFIPNQLIEILLFICITAIALYLYDRIKFTLENKFSKPKTNFKTINLEPDYKKLFAKQLSLRLQEKIESKFKNAKIEINDNDAIVLARFKKNICIPISGIDEFNNITVSLSENGDFNIKLFSVVDFDNDNKTEENISEEETERWYEESGQELLTKIITEMNQKGFSTLSIDENGDVIVKENGKYVVKEHFSDFPTKNKWHKLKKLMSDSGIKIRMNNNKLTFIW